MKVAHMVPWMRPPEDALTRYGGCLDRSPPPERWPDPTDRSTRDVAAGAGPKLSVLYVATGDA